MYLLKIFIICLTASAVFFVSCKTEGPQSPEEAFDFLKNAYSKSDAGAVEKIISEKSKAKIAAIIKLFSSMEESQLKALGKKFNVEPGKLKNLSVIDFLSIQISTEVNNEKDALKDTLKQKLAGVDNKEGKAVVRTENGVELLFVKENGSWKFDMEELSSKN
ncbi:MAG: hypothetical protein V1874_13115 [Spirochaetota bacterium]